MKIWVPMLVVLTALAGGCQNQQKPATTSASVLDVSGPAPRNNYAQPAPGYQPSNGYQPAKNQYSASPAPATTTTPPYMLPSAYPPPEPAPAIQVVEAQPPTAVPASATAKAAPTRSSPRATVASAAPAAGSNYTVKQGDTLYHIAKVHYGNGNQWQRIANANPGISPTSLKVGQVLVMP